MRELLETIVKGIVNDPSAVSVEERESVDFPGLTILEVTVADPDKGILIGRRGRTINAIRDLMTISAIRNEKKIKVLVKEDRVRESAPEQTSEQAPETSSQNTVEEENKQADDILGDL